MLECLVFGHRAALAALEDASLPSQVTKCHKAGVEAPVTPELREAFWEDAGLIRSAPGLARLASSQHLLASLVARCGLARTESRGGHFRADFTEENPALDGLHTVVRLGSDPELEPWS
jgi:L-aspartate oxidase